MIKVKYKIYQIIKKIYSKHTFNKQKYLFKLSLRCEKLHHI